MTPDPAAHRWGPAQASLRADPRSGKHGADGRSSVRGRCHGFDIEAGRLPEPSGQCRKIRALSESRVIRAERATILRLTVFERMIYKT